MEHLEVLEYFVIFISNPEYRILLRTCEALCIVVHLLAYTWLTAADDIYCFRLFTSIATLIWNYQLLANTIIGRGNCYELSCPRKC